VFRWINGKGPRQYGLDFGLWSRSVVADLIARKFAIRLGGLTAVGELLAKLGLTPQKPLQWAYRYLNNRLEQDHRGIDGRYRAMRGFKCPRAPLPASVEATTNSATSSVPAPAPTNMFPPTAVGSISSAAPRPY
jgi:hypothetical protein